MTKTSCLFSGGKPGGNVLGVDTFVGWFPDTVGFRFVYWDPAGRCPSGCAQHCRHCSQIGGLEETESIGRETGIVMSVNYVIPTEPDWSSIIPSARYLAQLTMPTKRS
jgi:hypothetical protein